MFDYLKGMLVEKNSPFCTLEANNIGWQILTNSRILEELGETGDEIKIYTKLIHKEDSMYLCGFKQKQDRIIFDILTGVSGVGVKVAFSLLDEFSTSELIEAVLDENHKLISRTKGIGPKMAQKIVLEIKDKLTKIDTTSDIIANGSNKKVDNELIQDAIAVLQSLGYSQNEYMHALETALSKLDKQDSSELIKETLKILSAF